MAKHGYLHIHAIGHLQPLLGLLLPFIPSPAQLHFTVVASQSIRMEMGTPQDTLASFSLSRFATASTATSTPSTSASDAEPTQIATYPRLDSRMNKADPVRAPEIDPVFLPHRRCTAAGLNTTHWLREGPLSAAAADAYSATREKRQTTSCLAFHGAKTVAAHLNAQI
ncbi:hypothetical protein CGMCC3_g11302 [Colletotrichum fructicola]|nr:uncharacterized protein CGMCC3_g11302 [Colletotrichum fructicola]KAE9572714.1 hypothetical protein CGMCC3_g11302 [Colletotrichum fructicola]